jgi:hypothetical protein
MRSGHSDVVGSALLTSRVLLSPGLMSDSSLVDGGFNFMRAKEFVSEV